VLQLLLSIQQHQDGQAWQASQLLSQFVLYFSCTQFVELISKPENLVFNRPGDDADLKLTDFGFATPYNPKKKLTATCGTPEYVAPEILNEQPYTEAVDMWSVGVILYNVLCGCPPFSGFDELDLQEKISACQYTFPSPIWDSVSNEAKDLISHLLTLDVNQRYKAEQALEHPWFFDSTVAKSGSLGLAMENLKKYNASRKLRKGVLLIVASNKIKKVVKKRRTASFIGESFG